MDAQSVSLPMPSAVQARDPLHLHAIGHGIAALQRQFLEAACPVMRPADLDETTRTLLAVAGGFIELRRLLSNAGERCEAP